MRTTTGSDDRVTGGVPGATHLEQVEAFEVASDVQLKEDVVFRMERVVRTRLSALFTIPLQASTFEVMHQSG